MADIHQIYITHCTHGSSALERREGELAHRMLGYSARAGSLDASELRRCYRQIERYVYYYLPRDTPGEQKLCQTAATAPRRLVYLPGDELQIVGQVCYRPTDSDGRPGSYFAHVLFRDLRDGAPAWSAVDCLRLWHAPGWVEEDSPRHPFRLPPLPTLDSFLAGQRSAIDDQVLSEFSDHARQRDVRRPATRDSGTLPTTGTGRAPGVAGRCLGLAAGNRRCQSLASGCRARTGGAAVLRHAPTAAARIAGRAGELLDLRAESRPVVHDAGSYDVPRALGQRVASRGVSDRAAW